MRIFKEDQDEFSIPAGEYNFSHGGCDLGGYVLSVTGSNSDPASIPGNPQRGSQDLDPRLASTNCLISSRDLLQIPGPNPAIVRGEGGEWDESVIESCDMFKDFGIYCWYYHGVPKDAARWPRIGYRVGLATAP